jgi:hypothetical protein
MIHEHGKSRWNDSDRGKLKNSEKKPVPVATFSTTNPTRNDPGVNLGHRGKRPATNRLSYRMARCSLIFFLVTAAKLHLAVNGIEITGKVPRVLHVTGAFYRKT